MSCEIDRTMVYIQRFLMFVGALVLALLVAKHVGWFGDVKTHSPITCYFNGEIHPWWKCSEVVR